MLDMTPESWLSRKTSTQTGRKVDGTCSKAFWWCGVRVNLLFSKIFHPSVDYNSSSYASRDQLLIYRLFSIMDQVLGLIRVCEILVCFSHHIIHCRDMSPVFRNWREIIIMIIKCCRPQWLSWMYVRLETRRSRVRPPPRLATFFRGDWSWNILYGHSLPSADSRRAVVSFWRKNVHTTG